MYLFNAHTDICENLDEKRARGMTHVLAECHVPVWKKGDVRGGFYPIWMNPDLSLPLPKQAERIISALMNELAECDSVAAVCNYDAYRNALRDGKHALIMGAEGLSFIGTDIAQLDRLYALGFRTASLTWNEKNELACGAGTDSADDSGLSEAGRSCVQRMQDLHMLIDLAHTSPKTFFDIAEAVDGTLIVSHGSCAALCDVSRNYTDRQLRLIADRDGVVGINAYPPFLSTDPERWEISLLAEHVLHAVNVAGEDHVGLGLDMVDYLDDFETDPSLRCMLRGMESEACVPALEQCLRARGMTETVLEKVFHGNFERMLALL